MALLVIPLTGNLSNLSDRVPYTPRTFFSGNGILAGTVKSHALPVQRRVWLYDKTSMRPVGVTLSDPVTGRYEFKYLERNRFYFVVAFDYTKEFNRVGADDALPEAMP